MSADWHTILFFVFATMILASSALVAFRPRPIESAMWLILNFFLTAGLYVLLGSHFTAVIQVLVYAGAIMVLFVFVILLLNLDPRELGMEASVPWSSLVLFLGTLTFILVALKLASPELMKPLPDLDAAKGFGTVEALSRELMTRYYWGFELAGVILLLAILGVGLLAYRKAKVHPKGGSMRSGASS